MSLLDLLFVVLRGYFFTVLIETPVLVFGLSPRYTLPEKIFAGVWLTAVSYPVVSLVLPNLIDPFNNRIVYLLVSEIFAPVSECVVFWWAFGSKEETGKKSMYRDLAVIVLANICSFAIGEVLYSSRLL